MLVVHQGRVAQSVVGVGDLQERWVLSDSTNFYLASVTNPFTALVIHQLARDGHLSYSDRLVRWIPELNATDSSITLQHLLTHSSGDLLRERVFAPTGMHAVLYDGTTRRVPLRAKSYEGAANGYRLSDLAAFDLPDGRRIRFTFVQTGPGGIFASLREMGVWVQALLDTSLLSAADKAAMFRAQRPAEGQQGIAEVRGVGNGWFESARGGQRVFWHDGSRGGSRAAVVLVPNAQLGIGVLSNVSHADPLELATVFLDRALFSARVP